MLPLIIEHLRAAFAHIFIGSTTRRMVDYEADLRDVARDIEKARQKSLARIARRLEMEGGSYERERKLAAYERDFRAQLADEIDTDSRENMRALKVLNSVNSILS